MRWACERLRLPEPPPDRFAYVFVSNDVAHLRNLQTTGVVICRKPPTEAMVQGFARGSKPPRERRLPALLGVYALLTLSLVRLDEHGAPFEN